MNQFDRQIQNSIKGYLDKEKVLQAQIAKYQEAIYLEADQDQIDKLLFNVEYVQEQIEELVKYSAKHHNITREDFINAVNEETERKSLIGKVA